MSNDYVPARADARSQVQLSNRAYDTLKWIAMVALPGASALYLALATIWGLPYATEIGGTMAALVTFLGLLLGVSGKNFWATTEQSGGILAIDTSGATDTYNLEVHAPLETLPAKTAVTFKIQSS